MAKFKAKLRGESDGHTVVRMFDQLPSAIAWLQGAGLAEYDDQTAHGEIQAEDGKVVWAKSHLQTAAQRERNERLDGQRLLASVGWPDIGKKIIKR